MPRPRAGFATCPGSPLYGDLTKTFSPSSIAPWLPMAGTRHLSRSFGASCPHIFRFTLSLSLICHQPVSAWTLSFLCVCSHDSLWLSPSTGSPSDGRGGEGRLCVQWDSRWIVCTTNFPRCHEVRAVIVRGNINNNFPCTYVSVSQECHADTNTVLICSVFEAEMCHKNTWPFKELVHSSLL